MLPAEPPPLVTLPRHLYLYDEPDALGLDLAALGRYVEGVLPACRAHVRPDFLTHHLTRFDATQRETLAEQILGQLERARLPAPDRPPPGELPLEEDDLLGDDLFHAPSLQALFHLLLPPEESRLLDLHLLFTTLRLGLAPAPGEPPRQLLALFGEPNLLSWSGLIEAPDPDREYRFLQVHLAMFGLDEGLEELDERFAPRMLAEGDPRLAAVLSGLTLQALFYRMWGESFCEEPTCRLHNAASHQQLLLTHTGPAAGLCPRHRAWLQTAGGFPDQA